MPLLEKLFSLEYVFFIPHFLFFTTLSFTALISFATYIIVYLVSCFFPNYGQFISCSDVFVDEDFVNSIPQSSIVTSLTLQGNISLSKLRSLFIENVLKSRSKVNPSKLRYPQLKQYLTTFICFRIWKDDPSFDIKNHVFEEVWNGTNLADIHQEYLNKRYEKQRSPWELVLIRNVNVSEGSGKKPTFLVILRIHHAMADAQSVIKLLVECLGNKQLKRASAHYIQETHWDKLKFTLRFPYKCLLDTYRMNRLLCNSFAHPWKIQNCYEKSNFTKNKTVVAFSSAISLSDLKLVAKYNKVKMSAVVMSLIAGAIRKVCGQNWDNEVATLYVLPKPNHPECLTNHMVSCILRLPTDQQCERKRLQQCNQEFSQVRDEHKERYLYINAWLLGLQIYPINRLLVESLSPVEITNNAGEMEGFFVGDAECIDYHLSVGTLRGNTGLVFCAHSYKDVLNIAVIAKESVISKENAENLADNITFELQRLLKT